MLNNWINRGFEKLKRRNICARHLLGTIATLLIVISCSPVGSPIQKDSTYDTIDKSGTVKIGYIAYPPSFIVDPNTRTFSGISYEILIAALNNLGLRAEFSEEVGWSTMIEAIDSKRIDIVATAVWPTAARARRADFSKPLFYSFVRAYCRADDYRFDGNLNRANKSDVTVSTIDGEMSAAIAKTDFPSAKTVSLTQLSDVGQLLLEVSSKKADIAFVEPAIAMEYMAKNPGKIRVVDAPPVRVFPNSFLLGRKDSEFRRTLDVALEELHNAGEISKIISKYEKYPGSFARIESNLKISN